MVTTQKTEHTSEKRKGSYVVTATVLMHQPEETEKVEILVAQHGRLVYWSPCRERRTEINNVMGLFAISQPKSLQTVTKTAVCSGPNQRGVENFYEGNCLAFRNLVY